MPDVPTTLPTELIAGTTWTWDREYSAYPEPTWTATAYFENSARTFNATAVPNGTAHRFTIAAATNAGYQAGRYQIRVRVTDGTQVFIAETGFVDIDSDPAAAGTRDTRPWARRTLEALEAFLEGNASSAQASMSIAGRSISRWSLDELRQWRTELRAEVNTTENTSKPGKGRTIKVRFT